MKVESVEEPDLGDDEVLVRMEAIGVNPVETYIRSGSYARVPPLPYTPGSDGAGVVEKAGPSSPWKEGDRVYLCGSLSGSYAEKSVCSSSQLQSLPAGISFEQGAAVYVPYATAYTALFHSARYVTAT